MDDSRAVAIGPRGGVIARPGGDVHLARSSLFPCGQMAGDAIGRQGIGRPLLNIHGSLYATGP